MVLICFWLLAISFPSPARADCYDTPGVANDVGTIGCLEDYVKRAIAFIFPLVGVVALIFLVFGGIRFILSGGEPKAVESAKKTITYALLGLAVIFSIFLIFGILTTMTGIDLLKIFQVVYP